MPLNLLDWILLLLLVAGACRGLRRGVLAGAGGLAGLVAGIWLAGRFYLPLAAWLGESLGLKTLISGLLLPFCGGEPGAFSPWGELWPFSNGLQMVGFPPSLWSTVSALRMGLSASARSLLLADALVKLLSFVVIWWGAGFLTGSALRLLSGVAGLLLPGGLNRLAGALLGLGTACLEVMVGVGMLTPVLLSLSSSLGVAAGLAGAWRHSLLIPLINRGWSLAAPVLEQFFHII